MFKNTSFRVRRPLVALVCMSSILACGVAYSQPRPSLAIAHRCGGVGEGNLQQLKRQAHDFNLGLWMVEGPRGAYLADVPIQVKKGNKTVASFVADGPLCYLKAPAGSYTLVGIYKGRLRSIRAHTGNMNVYLRW
ncbi:MAG: hypothetical protein ACYCSR_14520 [Thiomonas sp.]|uniref:Carboxypeptidase regulatory-like domain-containing protein n=1 Tax=mine drainage metagenome TaxID=410659 RepID=E6PQV3_9ZZZZ